MPRGSNRLAANTLWNVGGQVLPLLIGVVAIPFVIHGLGMARYGFLTLVWVLIGYAGLFDFGISRALTRVVAARRAAGDEAGAQRCARVGLTFLLCFGALAAIVLALCGDMLTRRWLGVPLSMQTEALHALWILALSLPLVMVSAGYVGVLTAYQRFSAVNLTRVFIGSVTYLGPLLILPFSNRLELFVGFVVLMRLVSNQIQAFLCRRYCGFALRPVWPDRSTSRELFALGAWMSVSNIVSPLLSYLDRLILGGLVAIDVVAYYATPYDLMSKILILPYAMTAALFPVVAGIEAHSAAATSIFKMSLRALFAVMFPVVFAIIVMSPIVFQLWLGEAFALRSAPVLQILAIGFLFNTLAQVPATMIQAAGNPRWMAQLHLCELPVFLFALWWFTNRYGIIGTAIASALRYSLDAAAVFFLAARVSFRPRLRWRPVVAPLVMVIILLSLAWLVPQGLQPRLLLLAGGLVVCGFFSWNYVLDGGLRARTLQLVANKS